MQMPRSYEEIVALSEELARSLEEDQGEPTISPVEAGLRAAALRRSLAESDLGQAVLAARGDGMSWDRIGDAVGTSGEAARQKYGRLTADVREVRTEVEQARVQGPVEKQPRTSSERARVNRRSTTTTIKVSRNSTSGRYTTAAAASKTRVAGAARKSPKPHS